MKGECYKFLVAGFSIMLPVTSYLLPGNTITNVYRAPGNWQPVTGNWYLQQ